MGYSILICNRLLFSLIIKTLAIKSRKQSLLHYITFVTHVSICFEGSGCKTLAVITEWCGCAGSDRLLCVPLQSSSERFFKIPITPGVIRTQEETISWWWLPELGLHTHTHITLPQLPSPWIWNGKWFVSLHKCVIFYLNYYRRGGGCWVVSKSVNKAF